MMFLLAGAHFLPCAFGAGCVASLATKWRSIVLAAVGIQLLWLTTGIVLFALGVYRAADIAVRDPRLLPVILAAVAPVYGLALLTALVAVHLRVGGFVSGLLTTLAGALGCIFVAPILVMATCFTFGRCP